MKPAQIGPFVEGFRDSLVAAGYAPGTLRHLLKEVGALERWMDEADVTVGDLNPVVIEQFRQYRTGSGRRRVAGVRSFSPLLGHLRALGVLVQEPALLTPVGRLVADYRRWLVDDRGLAAPTVLRYENTARRFLLKLDGGQELDTALARLTGASVATFLLQESTRAGLDGAADGQGGEHNGQVRLDGVATAP